jgi:MFS family permease
LGVLGKVVPAPFRGVFANADLRRLQFGWAASATSEQMAGVAFGVAVYGSGGATAVGVLGAVQMAAGALAAPFGGLLGDRLRRERLVLIADALRASALALAAVAVAAGAAWLLFPLAGMFGVGVALYYPARSALFPLLARSTGELTAVSVTTSALQSAGSLLGPLLAAVLLGVSVPASLAAAALVFAAGCIVISRIRDTRTVRRAPTLTTPLRDIAHGFQRAWEERGARTVLSLFCVQGLGRGALNVIVVVVPLQLLGLERSSVGYFAAVIGLGGVLFTASASRTLIGRPNLSLLMTLALVVIGAAVATMGAAASIAASLLCLLALGVATVLVDSTGYAALIRTSGDEILGRLLGLLELGWALGVATGSLLTSFLVTQLGVSHALLLVGLLLAALPLAFLASARRLDAALIVPAEKLAVLRNAPSLSSLLPVTLERLAARAEQLRLPEHHEVIRQGDAGDTVYVIGSGRMIVERNGTVIDRLGPGQLFGEIAILQQQPRTATVRTAAPSDLLTIGQQEFVAAISGHPIAYVYTSQLLDERMERVRGVSDP